MQTTFQTPTTGRVPKPSAARSRLRAAQATNRDLVEQRQAQKLERVNQLLEGAPDWSTNLYSLLDRFSSWQQDFGGATFAGYGAGGMVTTLNDRRYGKNFPIYQTETDLQMLRWTSRLLLATNGYAQGMLEGITSYVCGDGFTQTVEELDAHQGTVDPAILAKLNAVLDDFRVRNDWHGGEQPGLEEEIFQRGEEDGEAGECLYEDDAGLGWCDSFEPEQLTAPATSDECWRFGVYTELSAPSRPLRYWLRGWNTDLHGEEYDREQIVHYKVNVKRIMKRGVPSFSFGVADTLSLADNLRRNLGTGAGIQASIALIRQWETATQAQATGFQAAFADFTAPNVGGTTTNVKRYGPGGVEDIQKGMQYVAPPSASNTPALIQVLQACLRGATARWNAPEWIGSGDASNNNFASALVADAPFTKRVIRTQKRLENLQKRIFTWVLETRCSRQGVISAVRPDGTVVSMPWERLRRLVEVVVTAPTVEVRNKAEEAQANAVRVTSGWKSRQTVCEEEGGDWDREQARIDEWDQKNAPPLPALPLPKGEEQNSAPPIKGGDGEQKGTGSGKPPATKVTESREEQNSAPTRPLLVELPSGKYTLVAPDGKTRLLELADWDESKHKRASDGKFGSGGGSGKSDDKPAESPHVGKLADATDKLGAEVEKDPEAKEKAQGVLSKVGHALKALALGEFPAWALDTCDLWLFEDVLGKAGSAVGVPGAVLLTKAAAWGAAKAYLAIRGKRTTKESEEGGEDVLAIARKLHAVMAVIADAAGVKPPAIEELVHRLHEARK